jgi:hypothetical protein
VWYVLVITNIPQDVRHKDLVEMIPPPQCIAPHIHMRAYRLAVTILDGRETSISDDVTPEWLPQEAVETEAEEGLGQGALLPGGLAGCLLQQGS